MGHQLSRSFRAALCISSGRSDALTSELACTTAIKCFRQRALGLLLLLTATQAIGGTVSGPISYLIVRDSDGLVYVQVAGAISGRPSCAASTTYFMIPNENSEVGKKLYALLLAAKLAGQHVQIVGKNSCVRWSDGEDIEYVNVLP